MRVGNAADLIHWTYFMIDWKKVRQWPSDIKCADCGRTMNQVEPAEDSAGRKYDGYVCHSDKRLLWVKAR